MGDFMDKIIAERHEAQNALQEMRDLLWYMDGRFPHQLRYMIERVSRDNVHVSQSAADLLESLGGSRHNSGIPPSGIDGGNNERRNQ